MSTSSARTVVALGLVGMFALAAAPTETTHVLSETTWDFNAGMAPWVDMAGYPVPLLAVPDTEVQSHELDPRRGWTSHATGVDNTRGIRGLRMNAAFEGTLVSPLMVVPRDATSITVDLEFLWALSSEDQVEVQIRDEEWRIVALGRLARPLHSVNQWLHFHEDVSVANLGLRRGSGIQVVLSSTFASPMTDCTVTSDDACDLGISVDDVTLRFLGAADGQG